MTSSWQDSPAYTPESTIVILWFVYHDYHGNTTVFIKIILQYLQYRRSVTDVCEVNDFRKQRNKFLLCLKMANRMKVCGCVRMMFGVVFRWVRWWKRGIRMGSSRRPSSINSQMPVCTLSVSTSFHNSCLHFSSLMLLQCALVYNSLRVSVRDVGL